MVIFAKEGKGPESEFFWTERVLRFESWFRSEGNEPERDCESILIETTVPLDLSQLTSVQEQNGLSDDHPEGAGERAASSFDITAASSENVKGIKVMRKRRRRR